jgi:hypothetical protein
MLEAILVSPFTSTALALVLVVVGWKLNTSGAEWLLFIAWILTAISIFRTPPIAYQVFVQRSLWTMLVASVVGLGLCWLAGWQPGKEPPVGTPPFAITITTTFVNLAPALDQSAFWVVYRSGYGDTISPVPIALFMTIANRQDVGSTIQNYSVKARTRNCDWIDLIPIPTRIGKFFGLGGPGTFQNALLIDLSRNGLDVRLEGQAIEPHESAVGWLAFDSTSECRTPPREAVSFKVFLKDTVGVSYEYTSPFSTITREVPPPSSSADVQATSLFFTGEKIDVSKFHLKRYIDPIH